MLLLARGDISCHRLHDRLKVPGRHTPCCAIRGVHRCRVTAGSCFAVSILRTLCCALLCLLSCNARLGVTIHSLRHVPEIHKLLQGHVATSI